MIERALDEPRPKRIAGPPRRPVHRPHERVLDHVVRIGRAAGHPIAQTPEKLAMRGVERLQVQRHEALSAGCGDLRPATWRAAAAASTALAAAPSDSWPRDPIHSPAMKTLSSASSLMPGRPLTPPRSPPSSLCATVRLRTHVLQAPRAPP